MLENHLPQTLSSFLADLVEIRENNGVTLDDIRVRTKVYPHIIAQFEQDGLNEHPLFNVLYLKAFVRSYADVVGISPSIAARSYEDALSGKYDRRLAVEYLGLPELDTSIVSGSLEHKTTEKDARPTRLTEPTVIKSPSSEIPTASIGANLSKLKESAQSFLARMNESSVSILQVIGKRGILQWGVLALCIVLGAFLLIKLVAFQNESMPPAFTQEAPASIQETSVVEDTSDKEEAPLVDSLLLMKTSLAQSIIGRIESGDSLNVMVVAATGKLDPFRIRVDNDLRRPYWIDEGDSLDFWFDNQVTVEDNLDKMVILFESLEYPIVSTDSTAKVVISRDSANAFVYSSLQ